MEKLHINFAPPTVSAYAYSKFPKGNGVMKNGPLGVWGFIGDDILGIIISQSTDFPVIKQFLAPFFLGADWFLRGPEGPHQPNHPKKTFPT